MKDSSSKETEDKLQLLEQVDSLNDEVKSLALNLALYLAKAKAKTGGTPESVSKLEPEFIRLENGTVKVVQELTLVLNASRNRERHLYEIPSGERPRDQLEEKLKDILRQCAAVLSSLTQSGNLEG